MKRFLITTRRGFFKGLIAVAGSASLLPVQARSRHDELLKKVFTLVNSELSAIEIGKAYLKLNDESLDKLQLLQQISRNLGGERVVMSASETQLKQRFIQATRKDFENRNTVVVNGWVLSANEVSLWALMALA